MCCPADANLSWKTGAPVLPQSPDWVAASAAEALRFEVCKWSTVRFGHLKSIILVCSLFDPDFGVTLVLGKAWSFNPQLQNALPCRCIEFEVGTRWGWDSWLFCHCMFLFVFFNFKIYFFDSKMQWFLFLVYSCPHFPRVALLHPAYPLLLQSIPTLLSMSVGHSYMFFD